MNWVNVNHRLPEGPLQEDGLIQVVASDGYFVRFMEFCPKRKVFLSLFLQVESGFYSSGMRETKVRYWQPMIESPWQLGFNWKNDGKN